MAVAELTLGVMLTMARQISRADALMHAGKWEKKSLQGTELRSKTLGVVGLGKIGMEVARRASHLGWKLSRTIRLFRPRSPKNKGSGWARSKKCSRQRTT